MFRVRFARLLSTAAEGPTEASISKILRSALQPSKLNVQDISGGCGVSFAVVVESPMFRGKTIVEQHRMVNSVLKQEMEVMHALRISTKPTSPEHS
ncbi:mitochondrial BolA domain-containing protein [Andalucia godoyi]|uniref:Mitochondrial BolA domain-containing protein n=1 Tax=Andalucia godoyi TaxID=505711 RepID=A0A8K0AJV7_ANDGO|nr:mitochondrial BolA domain-containing protein [Andalucia godoyi]|eukprot:ANDGO_05011.mRNA.1 mitochondrial BolA domain-containing protein